MANCTTPSKNLQKEIINNFFEFFSNSNENHWFIGIGRSVAWDFDIQENANQKEIYQGVYTSSDDGVPIVRDSDYDRFEFFKNSIALKRIIPKEITFLIPKNVWQKNVVYQPYRHDEEMFSFNNNFYIFNESNNCVYKCIENTNFGPSAGSDILEGGSQFAPTNKTPEIIDTLDGYKWKFMYEISVDDLLDFSVSGRDDFDSFIPVKYIDYNPDPTNTIEVNQKEIQDSAVNGSLSSIYLNSLYNNVFTYDVNLVVFERTLDEGVTVGATQIDIPSFGKNNQANNAFKDMMIFVSSGPGSGQARPIKSSSFVNRNNKNYFEVTIDPLDYDLTTESKIDILPGIEIYGDGSANDPEQAKYTDLKTALALTKFDDSDTPILKSFDLLDIGRDYSFASARIKKGLISITEEIDGIPTDLLKISLSPFGGHGSNPVSELGASQILLKSTLVGTENGLLSAVNDFRQVGIIKNPKTSKIKARIRTTNNANAALLATGDSIVLEGRSEATSSATIESIYRFQTINGEENGYEFMVSGITDTSLDYEKILSERYGTPIPIDDHDGVSFLTVAGSESISLTSIVSNQSNINSQNLISPRDIVIGFGSKSSGIAPSLSTARIREFPTESLDKVFVENRNGRFTPDEKIKIIDRDGNFINSTFTVKEVTNQRTEIYKSVYNMTTKLDISAEQSNPFTPSTFVPDTIAYSFDKTYNSSELKESPFLRNAFVFNWRTRNNFRDGTLELVGVKPGSFEVGQRILYYRNNNRDNPFFATINSIIEPEIEYGTGEVLHVQNFAGIDRISNNEEEINLIIGL